MRRTVMKIGEAITVDGIVMMAIEDQWVNDFNPDEKFWMQDMRGSDGKSYDAWWGHESNGEGDPWEIMLVEYDEVKYDG